jgi:hypothetical protein
MDGETQLSQLYCEVWEQYQSHLWRYCKRMSDNSTPDFADEEVLPVASKVQLTKHYQYSTIPRSRLVYPAGGYNGGFEGTEQERLFLASCFSFFFSINRASCNFIRFL